MFSDFFNNMYEYNQTHDSKAYLAYLTKASTSFHKWCKWKCSNYFNKSSKIGFKALRAFKHFYLSISSLGTNSLLLSTIKTST